MFQNKFRWMVIGLLFFITVLNYFDRASIAYAMTSMRDLFHFNDEQVGLIFGAFGIGYMITTFLGGIVVDRYGARIILAIAAFFWSISVGLTGFATGFLVAYLARSMLGLAEGPNFPAMTRAIGDWLPKHERAFALANSLVAVPIALAIGAPFVTYLILFITWRGMFILLGILGLLWLPFWWIFFRDFPASSPFVNDQELQIIHDSHIDAKKFDPAAVLSSRRHITGVWKFILATPTLIANNWAFFVFGYFLFFFMTWLPTYLQDQYHLNLKEIGWFSVLPWAFAAILLWLSGYISDLVLRKTNNLRWARSYPIWISQLIAAVSIIPIIVTHNMYIALFSISLAIGFSMSSNAAFYATNIDIAKERAGSSLGVMDTAFALAGFAAPAITGWIVYVTHSFTSAFVLLAVLALSSVLVVIFFHRPEKTALLISNSC